MLFRSRDAEDGVPLAGVDSRAGVERTDGPRLRAHAGDLGGESVLVAEPFAAEQAFARRAERALAGDAAAFGVIAALDQWRFRGRAPQRPSRDRSIVPSDYAADSLRRLVTELERGC